MNYLAHLHIAHHTNTSYTGSIMGDFFKGQVQNSSLPEDLKIGILLHRKVDSFTDNHDFVKSLKSNMPTNRRYGGIVLDVLFDHILAKDFLRFHHQPLNEFSHHCYQNLPLRPDIMTPKLIHVLTHMKQTDWLGSYSNIETIELVLQRISQRLSKPVELSNFASWFKEVELSHFENFDKFYDELLSYSLNESMNLSSDIFGK